MKDHAVRAGRMRTLLVLATLALLTAPAVAAAPPDPVETVRDAWEAREHCFLVLAQPYENPVDAAVALVKAAVCAATA